MEALQIVEALSERGRLPIEAIRAAQADRDWIATVFLNDIQEFVSSGTTRIGANALFLAFHLLGEWREKSAYLPLASFLRRPGDALEPILGDAKTVTAHRVMASVFDGDPDPLHKIVRDEAADEFIRSRMIDAISMLTLSGELARATTAQFLRDCYDAFEQEDGCFVWNGWLDAVAWLGLVELKPLVQQAYDRGSIDPTWVTFKEFEKDLRHAMDHPDAGPLHPDGELTLFGDTSVELSNWACFQPRSRSEDTPLRRLRPSLYAPERNPVRNVGRNDPCPCGSGKKFKKCCLGIDPGALIERLSS